MILTSAVTERSTALSDIKRDALLIAAGALFIALCSRIEIPIRPVPITGQTFGVLFVAALLGTGRGTGAAALFLLFGISGLPLFSGGAAGIGHLFGPSGGYLTGFIAAAFCVGSLFRNGFHRTFSRRMAAMAIGNLVIYLFGMVQLSTFIGLEKAFTWGVLPFLAGDAFKIFFAACLLPVAGRRLNGR